MCASLWHDALALQRQACLIICQVASVLWASKGKAKNWHSPAVCSLPFINCNIAV